MSAFDVLVGYTAGMIVGTAVATWYATQSWRRLVDAVREDRNEWRAAATRVGDQLLWLTQQVVGLKRKGFEPSTAGKVTAAPDPETRALREVEDRFTEKLQRGRAAADAEFEESAVTDLMDQGLTRDQAITEAKRLRSSVTDMHPAGG